MDTFAGLNDEETQLLCQELLRRAALGFEQSGAWQDAAQCWADMGDHQQAAALYERAGDLEQAARAQLEAERYSEALALYQQWEQRLAEGNRVARVQALLGQAACPLLGAASREQLNRQGLTVAAGQLAYRQARLLLIPTPQGPLRSADAWVALGDYEVLLGRYDLVQEGYERVLDALEESASPAERVRLGHTYLAIVRAHEDRLLCQALEERLASWQTAQEEEPQPPLRPFPVEGSQVLRTLTGHTGPVLNLALSADGQTLVSSSNDRTIKVLKAIDSCPRRV